MSKTNSVNKDVLFLMSNFRMYPELMLSFEHNSICENQFLIACFCWDFELFSPEIDQNSKFAGTIGYIASYLEFLFPQFKIFTLHAKLHDAAGAVRAQSCKSPGYCYMVGRGQKSCLLGQMTGLLSFPYVKLFMRSFYKPIDF